MEYAFVDVTERAFGALVVTGSVTIERDGHGADDRSHASPQVDY
jgi:hypothetical protein